MRHQHFNGKSYGIFVTADEPLANPFKQESFVLFKAFGGKAVADLPVRNIRQKLFGLFNNFRKFLHLLNEHCMNKIFLMVSVRQGGKKSFISALFKKHFSKLAQIGLSDSYDC